MVTTYRVYVLENTTGRRYIGISDNPSRRLEQHNAGISRWAKAHRPWRLIWTSDEMPLGDARRFENRLKRQKGGRGFSQLTGLPSRD